MISNCPRHAGLATKTWTEVGELARKQHHYILASRALGEEGIAAFLLGDVNGAQEKVMKAYLVAKYLGDPAARVRYASVYGAGLVALKKYDRALKPLDEAIRVANTTKGVAYGRLRCGMATNDVPPKKPTKYLWPAEAVNIAQKKHHAVRLCEELIALTGYDKAACWRFLKKHGVERPGSGSRRTFDPTTVESIIEYVSEHGVRAASQRFHCEAKTLYNLIHRRGYSHYGKDLLSLRQICSHFCVRYSKVMSWIEQGLLKAKREQTRTGRPIYSIEFEALQKFCKEHRNLLITRRWPPQRIRFLEEYVFAPKHAELLRTRESKRENGAFDRGEYIDPDENFQRRA
jgi:hypothetical protein